MDQTPLADWRQPDSRKIDLDREVGWIVTAVLSLGWVLTTIVLLLVNDVPWIISRGMALAWIPLTIGIAALSYRWPVIEHRHSRYRVDEELIRIEHGVFWRSSIAVPRSRVQHLDVAQGPLQRRHGLATLFIYTAGTEYSQVSLPGLSHEVAQSLRDALLPRESRLDGV
ncbi:MAG TPA: PH domain-containing protein [Gemmatimonadaceae bacterium]|nr:PH domain-containing protein [Gemmatimonadaceae bacterium]